MAKFCEYGQFDACGLADLVRRKEITPEELLEEAVERLERLNPTLNAVVTKMYDQAQRQIRSGLPDGPFRGVPFLIKDSTSYAGVPTLMGSRFLSGNIPDQHSEIVLRYLKAGFVIIGKTSTPEFCLGASTEPRLSGPTRNPWNLKRTAGGSSGGAAAAVAAGIVPAAHGSDGGGSTRIPASCCGLLGLKPTRGRDPLGPEIGEDWGGLITQGILTRTVRDSAAILDVTSGPEVGAPYGAERPARPFLQEVHSAPPRLRIAYSTQAANQVPVEAVCAVALEQTLKVLVGLGHHVEQVAPPVIRKEYTLARRIVISTSTLLSIRQAGAHLNREPQAAYFEPVTWAYAEEGKRHSAQEYLLAIQELHRAGRMLSGMLQTFDIWITPVLAKLPVPIGMLDMSSVDLDEFRKRLAEFCPFTGLANAGGHPALSIPLDWSVDGLPVGVQFVGRYGDEATLFQLASQLEQARPWAQHKPPIHADNHG